MNAGDKVEIYDNYQQKGGKGGHVCWGIVERVTLTQIVVRNEHGNISKFRKYDLKMVGFSSPILTNRVRLATQAQVNPTPLEKITYPVLDDLLIKPFIGPAPTNIQDPINERLNQLFMDRVNKQGETIGQATAGAVADLMGELNRIMGNWVATKLPTGKK